MKSLRVWVAGVLWAAAYNLVWGVAWFGFMRAEWNAAFAAIKHRNLWTTEFWMIWIAITLPLAIAIAAYLAGNPGRMLAVSIAIWLLLAGGTTIWGRGEGLSWRVLTLDAMVNLVGVWVAMVLAKWYLMSASRTEKAASA